MLENTYEIYTNKENELLISTYFEDDCLAKGNTENKREILLDFMKNKKEKIQVLDSDLNTLVIFENGKMINIETQYEDDYKDAYEFWYNEKLEVEDDENECSNCGGGGCIHCDENFFF